MLRHLDRISAIEFPTDADQVKYEHDRAVNRVCFGGASGSWLVSGGQDGQMKLWVSPLDDQDPLPLLTLRYLGHPRDSLSKPRPQSVVACSSSRILAFKCSALHLAGSLRIWDSHSLRLALHVKTRWRCDRSDSWSHWQLLGDGLA